VFGGSDEDEAPSEVTGDTVHAVNNKIIGESMVTGGVSRCETGAEFVARVGDWYLVGALDFSTTEVESESENPVTELEGTSSSEDESEMSEDKMSSETSEDGKSCEEEIHALLTIQDERIGQTKLLDSKIVKKDLLTRGHIDPHQLIADRCLSQYYEYMVSEWLRLRRA